MLSILLSIAASLAQYSSLVTAASAVIDHKHYTGIPQALPEGFFKDADAISIAVGPEHACVLEVQSGVELGGQVYCWGAQEEYTRKSSIANKYTFVQISAGTRYTCGITIAQNVKCWGTMVPYHLKNPEGLYTQISCASNYMCGIMTDSRLNCIGKKVPEELESKTFVQVSCGDDHCCALDELGYLSCFGDQFWIKSEYVPTLSVLTSPDGEVVTEPHTEDPAFQVEKARKTEDVIEDDEEEDMEEGSRRKLGEDALDGWTQTIAKLKFKQVSVGGMSICGILYPNGELVCWGQMRRFTHDPLPGPYKQVSVGSSGACALREEDDVAECFDLAVLKASGCIMDLPFDQIKVGGVTICAVDLQSNLVCAYPLIPPRTDIVVA